MDSLRLGCALSGLARCLHLSFSSCWAPFLGSKGCKQAGADCEIGLALVQALSMVSVCAYLVSELDA